MKGMWFGKHLFLKLHLFYYVLPLFFFLFLGVYYLLRSFINDDSKFKANKNKGSSLLNKALPLFVVGHQSILCWTLL